jgi:hypothetical protein
MRNRIIIAILIIIIGYLCFDYGFTKYQDNIYSKDVIKINELTKAIDMKNPTIDGVGKSINLIKVEIEEEKNLLKIGDIDKYSILDSGYWGKNYGSTLRYNDLLETLNNEKNTLNDTIKEQNKLKDELKSHQNKLSKRIILFPNFSKLE